MCSDRGRHKKATLPTCHVAVSSRVTSHLSQQSAPGCSSQFIAAKGLRWTCALCSDPAKMGILLRHHLYVQFIAYVNANVNARLAGSGCKA